MRRRLSEWPDVQQGHDCPGLDRNDRHLREGRSDSQRFERRAAVAQAGLEKAIEKEARWVANQKALTSKVDAIAAAIKKRDQLAADVKRTEEARKALDEAFKLADKLAKEAKELAVQPNRSAKFLPAPRL